MMKRLRNIFHSDSLAPQGGPSLRTHTIPRGGAVPVATPASEGLAGRLSQNTAAMCTSRPMTSTHPGVMTYGFSLLTSLPRKWVTTHSLQLLCSKRGREGGREVPSWTCAAATLYSCVVTDCQRVSSSFWSCPCMVTVQIGTCHSLQWSNGPHQHTSGHTPTHVYIHLHTCVCIGTYMYVPLTLLLPSLSTFTPYLTLAWSEWLGRRWRRRESKKYVEGGRD